MIQQIKETSLYVQNLQITREFYEGLLEFRVIGYVSGRHVFFKTGGSVLLCFLEEETKISGTLPSHGAKGSIHIAFEVKASEYEYWKDKIGKLKIDIIKEHDWGRNLKSFYFRDPDNHLLEIVPEGLWDY